MDIFYLVLGLVLLIVGGDFLVKGSVALALRMRVSMVVIGLTVVSFATSAPELIVSVYSALTGHPDMAIGNVIGSNIARAFALVGAMSIVRFRNPIKETRDLVYIFMSIAIGMVCGTGFYSFAILFLFLVGLVEIIFKYSFFGNLQKNNYILSFSLHSDKFDDFILVIKNKFKNYSIISKEFSGINNETILIIINLTLKKNQLPEDIHKQEEFKNIVNKIDILSSEENIEN